MADRQKISSLTGQVEYDVAGKQIVSAVNAQVEYDVPGNQLISHVSAQVEYDGDKWQNNASLTSRHVFPTADILLDHTFNIHNLTASASPPTADTTNYKEGTQSASFVRASSQKLYITDANLKSGFPLKNGDTVKQGTFGCWFRPTALAASTRYELISKGTGTTSTSSIGIYLYGNNTCNVHWCTGSTNIYAGVAGIVINRWYHIAVSFDGVNKFFIIRLWDDTLGQVVDSRFYGPETLTGAMNVSTGDFSIGAFGSMSSVNFQGQIDEVFVFNRLLGWKEIDAIRLGTWTKQEDYVGLDVSQVQAQIEYDTFQAQRIYQIAAQVEVDDVVSYTSQLLAQVEYEEPPNLYTSQLLAQVEYEEPPNLYTSQLLVQVEYSPGCNFTASIGAVFSTSQPALNDGATTDPEGSIVWGQITGVVETIHSFASNWTGTGEIVNTGDGEEIELEDGEYMECSPVNTGILQIEILLDEYEPGYYGAITLKYRTGATSALCEAATYQEYTAPFDSEGFVQLRVEG